MRKAGWVMGMTMGFACIVAPHAAFALGGQWVTDDAMLADPGRCEGYAWYDRGGSDDQALEAELSCNPLGGFEITLGVGRFKDAGGWDTGTALEAKTLLRAPVTGGWGWGLVGRSEWSNTVGRHENVQAYVPVTVAVSDNLYLHVNGGGVWERDEDDALTWAAAVDVGIASRLNLIAESYGTHRGGTEFQVGLRQAFGAGHVDVSYAWARSDSSDNRITVGVAWMF